MATNLPWVVDAADLAPRDLAARVWVINDLEATAWGLAALPPGEVAELSSGAPDAAGNIAVVAAGTGLGEAGMYWDGQRHHPFATEGGHANFAPDDDVEAELLVWLRKRVGGHVSWERVVSGPGLLSVYEFLRDSGRGEEPAWLADALRQGDPGATISSLALEGKSPLCVAALDRFVGLYGSEAGNAALKMMATGGVYLGGGIAPRIVPKLEDGTFLKRFLGQGPDATAAGVDARTGGPERPGRTARRRTLRRGAGARIARPVSGPAPARAADGTPRRPRPPRRRPSAAGSPRSCRDSARRVRDRPRSPASAGGRGCSGREPR